ncbi:MAG: hypothetical protein OP8BY_2442 [Candidatus Saccharicenans subterraneus]|uniref:Uncharacterized protein n=1 Tax=Candidatus Saccharicenans subterraneus TaxID=2508984 RepID=A0A3E2BIY4_9BACT|nr:MAG: hypothetical protein OP8BY_2442 [Candidatus Saccharicenans subterraneum]
MAGRRMCGQESSHGLDKYCTPFRLILNDSLFQALGRRMNFPPG